MYLSENTARLHTISVLLTAGYFRKNFFRFLSLDPCVHSGIWASLWLLLTLAWAVTGRGSLS